MRAVILAIGLLALLWSGYWFYGSRGAAQASRDWFAARADAGWQAAVADISVRGFPNRFDMTLADPRLALPSGRAAWSAPFLQVLRLSYMPEHTILVFPPRQMLTVGGVEIDVASVTMRASAVFERDPAGGLDRANLVADGLTLRWRDRTLTAASALAAIRRTPARDLSYDLALELRQVVVDGPDGAVTADRVALDSTAEWTAPLTLSDPAGPTLTLWRVDRLQLGGARLGGEVTFEVSGPAGTLTGEPGDAAGILALARALGLAAADAAVGQDRATIEIRRNAVSLNGIRLKLD